MSKTLSDIFKEIFEKNIWASQETVSGGGSEKLRSQEVQVLIPRLVKGLGVKSFLDAGCGDLNWFPLDDVLAAGSTYTGVDIVEDLVTRDYEIAFPRIHPEMVDFAVLDIVNQPIKGAFDMILCRTVLFHLSFDHCLMALQNFCESGSKYLLMTTHPNISRNTDIEDGQWRRVNFCLPPFSLPEPLEKWADGPAEGKGDGFIGLWELREVEKALICPRKS